MACVLSALSASPLGEYLESEIAGGIEPQILLRDVFGSGGLETCFGSEGNNWIDEKLVQALVDILLECTAQDIAFGAFEALQYIFTRQREFVKLGPHMFIEFLRRLGYERKGCSLNWEQEEDLREKGVTKFECPMTTVRVQLVLKLIPSALHAQSRVFSSRLRAHTMVDFVSTLVHLQLNVSRHYYEPELDLALSSVFAGTAEDVVKSLLRDIVAALLELGASHRSQVQMIKTKWDKSQTASALKQLWCALLLHKLIPLQVYRRTIVSLLLTCS